MIQVQLKDFDDVGIDWLFGLKLGVWELVNVRMGITESHLSKKAALLCLLPVFVLIYISLGFASWMVTGHGQNWFWRFYFGFWRFYFGLFLFP